MFCHFQTNTIGHSSCCLCLAAPLKLDGPKTPWWMRSFRGSLSSAVVWWICRASQRNGGSPVLFVAVAQVGVTERSVGLVSCFAFFLEIGQKTFQENQTDMRIMGLHSTFWIRNASCFDPFFCGKWICWWHQVADLSSDVSGGLWWGIHRVPLWRGRAIEDWCWRRSLSAKDLARGEVQRKGGNRWEREQQITEKARGVNSWC